MTAEERAKAIVDAEWEFIKANDMFVSAGTLDRIQASLTAAITAAENEKLEEAARALLTAHDYWHESPEKIGEFLRSFKSKD